MATFVAYPLFPKEFPLRPEHSKFLTMLAFLSLGIAFSAEADEHKHGAPLHGGKVAMTKEYHFEVVFVKEGVKVYPRSHEDQPLDASRLSGTATFYHPNSPNPWFERKLTPAVSTGGKSPSTIGLMIDLSKVPTTGARVDFKVEGLPEPAETNASFSVPFVMVATGGLVVTKATKADEKAIAALKMCPVSNEDLNSMGGPLKVALGEKATYICCKGCLKQIQANPDKVFGRLDATSSDKENHNHRDH